MEVDYLGINGLFYKKNFIKNSLHDELLEYLSDDNEFWKSIIPNNSNSRKVMHFGYAYNYTTNNIHEKAEKMPKIIKKLRKNLKKYFSNYKQFNQCIINKYLPGQGISKHIDRTEFGNTICCVTIGSGAVMKFTQFNNTVEVNTTPRSLYVMTNDARYKWRHEMENRKYDIINEEKIERGIRYSITFRIVTKI